MHRGLTVDILSQIFIASSKSTKEINHKINRGLIVVYIPSWIFLNSSKKKTRDAILKEIGQEINRGLLVHIPPQTSIESALKCKETQSTMKNREKPVRDLFTLTFDTEPATLYPTKFQQL